MATFVVVSENLIAEITADYMQTDAIDGAVMLFNNTDGKDEDDAVAIFPNDTLYGIYKKDSATRSSVEE